MWMSDVETKVWMRGALGVAYRPEAASMSPT